MLLLLPCLDMQSVKKIKNGMSRQSLVMSQCWLQSLNFTPCTVAEKFLMLRFVSQPARWMAYHWTSQFFHMERKLSVQKGKRQKWKKKGRKNKRMISVPLLLMVLQTDPTVMVLAGVDTLNILPWPVLMLPGGSCALISSFSGYTDSSSSSTSSTSSLSSSSWAKFC